jgi:hypothetical protein
MGAFNIRKDLKAYVKYSLKNGQKIVPGSLVFRKSVPRDPGIWKEVPTVKCCTSFSSCAGGGFWANAIEQEFYSYPKSVGIGNDCSIYYFGSNGDYPQFLKFNSDGSLVWNSPYSTNQEWDQQSIKAIPDNSGAIAVFQNTIVKLSAEDGSLVWKKTWGDSNYVYLVGVDFDAQNNIILFAIDHDVKYFLVKINSVTGDVISQKEIDFSPIGENIQVESQVVPKIDGSGNIYICGTLNYNSPTFNYGPIVLKFDNQFNLSLSIYVNINDNNETEQSSFDIDLLGNYYITTGLWLTKVNNNGDHAWTVQCEGIETGNSLYLYCCAVSPEGDVYWVYNQYDANWNDNDPDYVDKIVVVKINTEGVLQWATSIGYAPGGSYSNIYVGGWQGTNDPIQYKNGVLAICGNMPNYSLNHLLKVSPDQVTGTFGDFVYEDITDKLSFNNYESVTNVISPTVSDSTYFDPSNEYNVSLDPGTNSVTVTTNPT